MKNKLNILIIDDCKQDRVLLIDHLRNLGKENYKITQVNSPNKGLAELSSKDYDLVFLDFLMDEGDGLSFLNLLSIEQKKKLPIIFLTGYGNSMIKEDSIEIGAKAYIDKNEINQSLLEETINKVLA